MDCVLYYNVLVYIVGRNSIQSVSSDRLCESHAASRFNFEYLAVE